MTDMLTEQQRQIASTPRGENSFKYKLDDSATQAAQRARSIGCEEHGGRQIVSTATDNLNTLAQTFISDFEKSKIELVPLVKGQLFSMSIFPKETANPGKNKTTSAPSMKYFVLDPLHGDIGCFKKESDYKSTRSEKAVFIKLQHVLCIWGPSKRDEMRNVGLHSIEMSFANESTLLLGAYEPE